MQLFIANKNYSSWSMRSWVLLKAFDIQFEEKMILFPEECNTGSFKQNILAVNSSGKVPVLLDQELLVWDSLAIAEYLAEKFPEKGLWPSNLKWRAHARCISAEMHSSFQSLRELCGMNIRANFKKIGAQLWENHLALQSDIIRIEQIWSERPNKNGFLCGDFSIADAFYAPVITRILTYGLPVSKNSQSYIQLMLAHPAIEEWMTDAKNEIVQVSYYDIYKED